MVHVVDGRGEDGRHHLQRGEHGLGEEGGQPGGATGPNTLLKAKNGFCLCNTVWSGVNYNFSYNSTNLCQANWGQPQHSKS